MKLADELLEHPTQGVFLDTCCEKILGDALKKESFTRRGSIIVPQKAAKRHPADGARSQLA